MPTVRPPSGSVVSQPLSRRMRVVPGDVLALDRPGRRDRVGVAERLRGLGVHGLRHRRRVDLVGVDRQRELEPPAAARAEVERQRGLLRRRPGVRPVGAGDREPQPVARRARCSRSP